MAFVIEWQVEGEIRDESGAGRAADPAVRDEAVVDERPHAHVCRADERTGRVG